MISNRSMPQAALIPVLSYPDVAEAIDWLGSAFGFGLRWRVGDHRAQLAVGSDAAVAIVSGPAPGADATDHVMVRVEDAQDHHDRAQAAGARVEDVEEFPYGERQYRAVDLSGRTWLFSQSIADRAPEDWGGTST